MRRIPGPSELNSNVMWMWHDDGIGPAVYWADIAARCWRGQISFIDLDQMMQDGWNFCGGCRMTLLPTDENCPELERVHWPMWLEDAWCELVGHSRR